ncbi:MAG: hypothetical protein NPINA01_31930 [Nitrospinaceae bacterium]|nr:MAG: hypothetical protein NPINA01_31930 [Nitrospinaceae bacterium]
MNLYYHCKIFPFRVFIVKRSINILLLAVAFFLVGISGVNASVSHDHHEEIGNSPFEVKSKDLAPHCPLDKHSHNSSICPHAHAQGGKKEVRIAADCGGNPSGAVPAPVSFSKNHYLFSVNSFLPDFKYAENIFVSYHFFQPLFFDRIDHPPSPISSFSV